MVSSPYYYILTELEIPEYIKNQPGFTMLWYGHPDPQNIMQSLDEQEILSCIISAFWELTIQQGDFISSS
jgi:hypothetical protein